MEQGQRREEWYREELEEKARTLRRFDGFEAGTRHMSIPDAEQAEA